MFDLAKHLHRHREFSLATFGPGKRRKGVADHIRKELDEIEADPEGKGECEWIDVIILGFDGALRDGRSPEEIIRLIVAKQAKNEGRKWPDWRLFGQDQAIEHDRSGEMLMPLDGQPQDQSIHQPGNETMTETAEMLRPETHIHRPVPNAAILAASGRTGIHILAGSTIEIAGRAHAFDADMPVAASELAPGNDYGISLDADGLPVASRLTTSPLGGDVFAGFHFAAGGNATARSGGDNLPAINPFSAWDLGFRPACPDPRGMALAEMPDGRRLWVDIYLLGVGHREDGTSRYGVEIADGASLDRLDYRTAVEILAGHGKRLMTYDEFRVAAIGVTEKSAAARDPKKTGIDTARTSRIGLMQATGNLWIWGTDGDPDSPRPSLFGGSWIDGGSAGSRCTSMDDWAGYSLGSLGCRGACDHL